MSKIVVEYDTEELKTLITELLTERVIRQMPKSTKIDIAKYAAETARKTIAENLVNDIQKDVMNA
jgi:mannitol-specific phosphotransferase system IIBC component